MHTTSHMTRLALPLYLSAIFLLTSTLIAQRGGSNESPRNRMMSSFNQSAPKVGDKLPPLEAFDANGQPWSTEQLKGKYSVLVFGCLT